MSQPCRYNLQMISMNCNTSNWIIALIYSIFAMVGRTVFELAFQSVGMLSVILYSELKTSRSMAFQFLQTLCCVADSRAKANSRAMGVQNKSIHHARTESECIQHHQCHWQRTLLINFNVPQGKNE